ncbi:MAG: elongation factor P [Raineya sp.]|nr:elongation factor P [Raineya sp.]MDW8295640.1 elongation factor P [Raineya sp.]
MAKASDVSRGNFIRYNGEIMQVIELEHRTPGNLRAFYQMKMRNVKNGRLAENRFRPDENVEIVRVEVKDMMFSYRDGENLVCMDNETYDQIYIPAAALGESINFLKEGSNIRVSFDDTNTPIAAELPASVELLVTYTEPGVKGDTATRAMKPATLETGAVINVPLFVNEGELIRVNTLTGEYMERVK